MSRSPSPPAADVEAFVDHLPKVPEVYMHLFELSKSKKKKDDDFVRDVFIEAERRGVVWKMATPARWKDELNVFLLGRRGVVAFREWLKVSYVKELVEEKMAVKTVYEWRTLAHAVADFKHLADYDLFDFLLSEYPDLQNVQVSSTTSPCPSVS
jgi:hypothetical protein